VGSISPTGPLTCGLGISGVVASALPGSLLTPQQIGLQTLGLVVVPGWHRGVRLSQLPVSPPAEGVAVLDEYTRTACLPSRSAAVQYAIRQLSFPTSSRTTPRRGMTGRPRGSDQRASTTCREAARSCCSNMWLLSPPPVRWAAEALASHASVGLSVRLGVRRWLWNGLFSATF
jgi:hypothetical protein